MDLLAVFPHGQRLEPPQSRVIWLFGETLSLRCYQIEIAASCL
jgi:hypothetical protein